MKCNVNTVCANGHAATADQAEFIYMLDENQQPVFVRGVPKSGQKGVAVVCCRCKEEIERRFQKKQNMPMELQK